MTVPHLAVESQGLQLLKAICLQLAGAPHAPLSAAKDGEVMERWWNGGLWVRVDKQDYVPDKYGPIGGVAPSGHGAQPGGPWRQTDRHTDSQSVRQSDGH